MPRYDYRCDECDIVFEIVRPADDRSECACPECATPARRVFSPVGVVFKGSGFHSTDYRNDASPSDKKDSADGGCDSSTSAACESCPAKKGD